MEYSLVRDTYCFFSHLYLKNTHFIDAALHCVVKAHPIKMNQLNCQAYHGVIMQRGENSGLSNALIFVTAPPADGDLQRL